MSTALQALNRIGMELMYERDLPRLLARILSTARQLTQSDGGVLFLVEPESTTPELIVHHFEFHSLTLAGATRTRVPIDEKTIAGHAATTKQPVVVRDAYDLPPDSELVIDRTFDERHSYHRRSMLFVPLVDHLDHLGGLLLLVNKKSDPHARLTNEAAVDQYVQPYSKEDVDVARSLAGQAAVAIENARLYTRIERTLESLVEAAVTAVDERDPAIAGHSLRVADLSIRLARAVDTTTEGTYRDVHFTGAQLRELRFAALLHDVGKLVVPESVLLKERKLPPVLWERVAARFDLARAILELDGCNPSEQHDGHPMSLDELEHMRQQVAKANEPSILDREVSPEVASIGGRTFRTPDGRDVPFLTSEALHFLEITRGTLDEKERALVEHHAEAAYRLLREVLWTDELKNVATYAYGHHEKLDGSGYPRHLRGADIPLQSQIIAMCDMFDALTEADRPYKGALSSARALEILRAEATAGRIAAELLEIMTRTLTSVS